MLELFHLLRQLGLRSIIRIDTKGGRVKKELVVKAEGRFYAGILIDAMESFPTDAEIQKLSIRKLDSDEVELTIIGVWS